MAFEELVKQVAETLQKEGSVRAVFGEPVKLDTHIVVPVALVSIELGGGGTGATRKEEKPRDFFAGGGSVKIVAKPAGFIHEQDGKALFTVIAEPHEPMNLPPLAKKIIEAVTPAKH
ncbi:MAG TPA: hypothetical protein VLW85_15795 [Myxococcales bacterium]|nr:hypothetical protein [Myxococcales bacterium]